METCCAKVAKGSDGWRTRYAQCTKPGKVERDGKWYCGQHDPHAKEARYQKTRDRWAAETREEGRKARLAAAAPALLEALELVWDTYGMDPSVDSAIWQTVQAAIGKAKDATNAG